MNNIEKYEAVIGLEVHAQLLTNSKAYSSEENTYGANPNTKTCPISLGHPGTLPVANSKVIDYAIKMGIAIGSKIRKVNEYARKNYFYADLPKGFQITQDKTPICNGGNIEIKDENGKEKTIRINRIHMEEDAGKSIHDLDPFHTLIDLNRAGIPLIEIVTEPDITSSDQAYNYIQEIRKLVRYLEICDGNMEEGSLRCDANVSVRLKGSKKLGTKVEVKNMNSISNVKKAIEFEINRQIHLLEEGVKIIHETRSFNAFNGETISMRHKEKANDYRYFPEPDLQPIIINQEYISKVKNSLPLLPKELFNKFTSEFGLSKYDTDILIEEKELALYYLEIVKFNKNYKSIANIVNGPIKAHLNELGEKIENFSISAKRIAELIQLIDDGKISNSIATSNIFTEMLKSNKSPLEIAQKHNLIQESNTDYINNIVEESLKKYPEKVKEYKSGKKGLIGLFMGEIMKISKGKADPKLANKILIKELEK
tara:strand:- start:21088 stop:22536 length:1449 start_codon:yes stop_codon:yes gene_type:complete